MHSRSKTACILAAIVLASTLPAHATPPTASRPEQRTLSFCAEPFLSAHWSYLGEHLFTNDDSAQNPQTSYLEWQLGPMLMAGIRGTLNVRHVLLEAAFSAGLPARVGSMYDSDWFMNTDVRQSMSVSHNDLVNAYYTDASLGYRFVLSKAAALVALAGYSYRFITLTAPPGGTGTTDPVRYDDDVIAYDSEKAKAFHTSQLDYWRETQYVWLALRAECMPHDRLRVSLSVGLGVFSKVLSVDHHYNNAEFYTDMPQGFFCAARTALRLDVRISRHLCAGAQAQLLVTGITHGDTYTSRLQGHVGFIEEGFHAGASELDCDTQLFLSIQ